MNVRHLFEQFRKDTDDLPAAILTLASVLAGEEADRLLTVKQAAEKLNVSLDTIYNLCCSGKLKHRRIGKGRGTIRIASSDLDTKVVPLRDLIR